MKYQDVMEKIEEEIRDEGMSIEEWFEARVENQGLYETLEDLVMLAVDN